jgi:hypothetical protein
MAAEEIQVAPQRTESTSDGLTSPTFPWRFRQCGQRATAFKDRAFSDLKKTENYSPLQIQPPQKGRLLADRT